MKLKDINLLKLKSVLISAALFLMFISCKERPQVLMEASTKSIAQSVSLIKEEIQKKGVVSSEEALGLNLLNKMMSGSTLDNTLTQDVQSYMNTPAPSDLSKELINVFDLVQTQGNIADSEMAALDGLIDLISLDKGVK